MTKRREAPDRFKAFDLTQGLIEDTLFFTHEDCPFKAAAFDGDRRVLVITGENAAGKSFLFKALSAEFNALDILPVTLSIRERTGGGTFEMSRMRQMFIYGDEADQSTGATSARVVKSGFHNAGREDRPGVLMLDEPEMGLSDGYARALGELIGQKARTPEADGGMNDACHGVVVVSHNRPLVDGLIQGLGGTPAFVNMNAEPLTLNDWLLKTERRSIADLEKLNTLAGERRKATHAILNELKNR